MSVFRRLLIVLLLAALPLQGYAAAAMLYCHARGAAEPAQTPGAHEHGHGHGSAAIDVRLPQPDPAIASVVAPMTGDDASQNPLLFKPNCSVCSSTCVGAAIIASTPVLQVVPDGRSPFEPVTSVFAGVVLDLPDPPPLAAPL